MKKLFVILALGFFVMGTCFADTPYSPYRNREGWNKSVHFPVSKYSDWNSNTWTAEAFAYEIKNYENKSVGYVLAIENPRDKKCYFSAALEKTDVLEALQYLQNHYCYIDDMDNLFMPKKTWYRIYEDANGNLWKLEQDYNILLLVKNLDSDDEWTRNFIINTYDYIMGDNLESFESKQIKLFILQQDMYSKVN